MSGIGLAAALRRLDVAIEGAVMRQRSRYQLSLDEFRGLYVSDEQVDALLLSHGLAPARPEDLPPQPRDGPLAELVRKFKLAPLEADLLLTATAPAIDLRYATLYAYLNDDVIRRQATLQLAQRLFAGDAEQRSAVRRALVPQGRLLASGLLHLEGSEEGALAAFRAVPATIAHLQDDCAAAAIGLTVIEPSEASDEVRADAARLRAAGSEAVFLLDGPDERTKARRAAAVAGEIGLKLVSRPDARSLETCHMDALAAHLSGAMLLLVDDGNAQPCPLPRANGPLAVSVGAQTPWERQLGDRAVIRRTIAVPDPDSRKELWREALRGEGLRASPKSIALAASRFRLPASAISHAARDVGLKLVDGSDSASRPVPAVALLDASRARARLDLAGLAEALEGKAQWKDLVLPREVLDLLSDLAQACALRGRVYDEWGMRGPMRGSGIAALFCGASGTGKTMSAGVVADAAGLDLWRIDLSSVVSKYIGETEKNLERIFSAARGGDAILFFDEADALFGKRSEVRDAHDRYANIEIAYLLQRLEVHDGIVILASNFRSNIDSAFMRRLQFVVEFPIPDAPLREQLWRKAFAGEVPLAEDIDYRQLARKFELAGGDIRTSALDAAFLAAAGDGVVGMEHILHGVARQLLKQGRVPPRTDGRVRGNGSAEAHAAAGQ